MEVIELIKGFLLSPTETFQKVREIEVKESFKYLTVLVAIYSVLSGIISMLGMRQMVTEIIGGLTGVFSRLVIIFGVFSILVIFVAIIILMIIEAAILHLFVYLVGGREGVKQTLKVVIYSSTPSLLLGWIPLVGGITKCWALVLAIIGIRELQKLSTGRAAIAALLPIIIAALVIFSIIDLYF
jgi:hypothetical protein